MNDFIELKDPLQASIFKDLIDHSSWSICTRDFYDYCTKGFGLSPSGWRWSIELAQLQSRCSLKSIHHLRHTWVLAVTSFRGAKTKKKKRGGSPSRAKLPILIVNLMKITKDINKPLTIMASGSLAHSCISVFNTFQTRRSLCSKITFSPITPCDS